MSPGGQTVCASLRAGGRLKRMNDNDFMEMCIRDRSHRVKNFFTDNYPQPIWDDGVLLTDMVYFVRLF